jgi:exosortase A-associated hydrolase 2
MTASHEEAFYFSSAGQALYGVLHAPAADGPRLPAPRGVVYCAPFAEEQTLTHRVGVTFARQLAAQGYWVLRFDYYGCGDSAGEFEEATLQTRLADIAAAVGMLRERMGAGKVTLWGFRLGATLACLAAEQDSEIDSLLLWEPIVNVPAYFDQFLRMQVMAGVPAPGTNQQTREGLLADLAAGQVVDVLGYGLGPQCFAEFQAVAFPAELERFAGRALIVAINKRTRERKDLQGLADAYREHGAEVIMAAVQEQSFWIDPNDSFRESEFWHGHEALYAESRRWLAEEKAA